MKKISDVKLSILNIRHVNSSANARVFPSVGTHKFSSVLLPLSSVEESTGIKSEPIVEVFLRDSFMA